MPSGYEAFGTVKAGLPVAWGMADNGKSGYDDPDRQLTFINRLDRGGELYFHEGIQEYCYLSDDEVRSRIEPDPVDHCHRCDDEIVCFIDPDKGDFAFSCPGGHHTLHVLDYYTDDYDPIPHYWQLESLDVEQADNPHKVN